MIKDIIPAPNQNNLEPNLLTGEQIAKHSPTTGPDDPLAKLARTADDIAREKRNLEIKDGPNQKAKPEKNLTATKPYHSQLTHQEIQEEKERDKEISDLLKKQEKRKKKFDETPPIFTDEIPTPRKRGYQSNKEKKENSEPQQELYPVVDIPLPYALAFVLDPHLPVTNEINRSRMQIAEMIVTNQWSYAQTLSDLITRIQIYCTANNEKSTKKSDEIKNHLRILTNLAKTKEHLLYTSIDEITQSLSNTNGNSEFSADEINSIIECAKFIKGFQDIINSKKSEYSKGILRLPKYVAYHDENIPLKEGLGFLASRIFYAPFQNDVDQKMYKEILASTNNDDMVSRLNQMIREVPFRSIDHPEDQLSPPGNWNMTSDRYDSIDTQTEDWLKGLPNPFQIQLAYQSYYRLFQELNVPAPTHNSFPMEFSKLVYPTLPDGTVIDYSERERHSRVRELAGFYSEIHPFLIIRFIEDCQDTNYSVDFHAKFITWFAKRGIALIHFDQKLGETNIVEPRNDSDIVDFFSEIPAEELIVDIYEIVNFFQQAEEEEDFFYDSVFNQDYSTNEYFKLNQTVIPNLNAESDYDFESVLNILTKELIRLGWLEVHEDKRDKNNVKKSYYFNKGAPRNVTLENLAELCGSKDTETTKKFCELFKTFLNKKHKSASFRSIRNVYALPDAAKNANQTYLEKASIEYKSSPYFLKGITRKQSLYNLPQGINPLLEYVRLPKNGEQDRGNNSDDNEDLVLEQLAFPVLASHFRERVIFNAYASLNRNSRYAYSLADTKEIQDIIYSYKPSYKNKKELEEKIKYLEQQIEDLEKNYSLHQSYKNEKKEFLTKLQQDLDDPYIRLTTDRLPAKHLIDKWVRPLIASYVMAVLSEKRDVVVSHHANILNDDEQEIVYSSDNEKWKPIITAKSRAISKLMKILDKLDLTVSPKSTPEWKDVEPILLEAAEIMKELGESLANFDENKNNELKNDDKVEETLDQSDPPGTQTIIFPDEKDFSYPADPFFKPVGLLEEPKELPFDEYIKTLPIEQLEFLHVLLETKRPGRLSQFLHNSLIGRRNPKNQKMLQLEEKIRMVKEEINRRNNN